MEQFGKKQFKNHKNHGGGNKQAQQQHCRHFNHATHNPNMSHYQRGGVIPRSPFLAYATTPNERHKWQTNSGSVPKKKQLEEQELLCPKCTRYYQVTKQEQQFGNYRPLCYTCTLHEHEAPNVAPIIPAGYSLHGPAYSSLPNQRPQQHLLRLPYVLPCDHTICGDCIRSAYGQRTVKCPECDVCATIEVDKEPDKSFAINYYLVGRIFLLRNLSFTTEGVSTSSHFPPAGAESIPYFVRANIPPEHQQPYNYNQPAIMQMQEYGAGEPNRFTNTLANQGQRCSMKPCAAPAILNCVNCEAIFCASCSNVLHGGEIAGLKDHRTRPLQPQLLSVCPKHAANVLDFHCVNCDVDLCCYCLIEGGHAGHEHVRLTVLNEDQKVGFKELIFNAEEKLRKLEHTYKVAEKHINVSVASGQPANGEKKQHQQLVVNINKHFADLMAKVLNTHHRLRKKLDMAQHASVANLRSIQTDILQRLNAGKNLLSQGRLVLESSDQAKAGTAIFNVATLRRELEEMMDWPSCLVDGRQGDDKSIGHIEFISDLSENMDKFCTLKVHDANQFQLVSEDSIPNGFSVAKSPGIAPIDYPDSSSQSSYQSNVSSVASTSRQSDFNRPSRPPSALSVSKMPPVKQNTNIITTPTVGGRMAVSVVHINHPGSIYVQLIDNLPILKAIHNDLANYVKNLSTCEVSDPIMGEFYIVKQNIHWVRARCLKSSKRADFFIVQLLETGQMIDVLKLHMRECSAQLRKVPPMAYQCRLNNLYPHDKDWSAEAKKLLDNILTLKSGYVSPFYPKHRAGEIESCNVSMQVINRENNIYSVELIASREDLSTVLSNALLFTGLAKPIDTSNEEYDLKTIDGIKIYENTSKIDVHQRMRVSLVHVEDPYNIYVHLYNFLSHIKDLIRNMNLFYLENNRGIIYTPKIGMYVSVVYSEGQSYNWYRGKIVNVINGVGKVDVLLIDFGKTVNVEYKNLRTLPVTFTMLECQAVHIRLADIAPPQLDTPSSSDWPEATMEFLREFIKAPGHHLEIAVTEGNSDPFLVVLFECLPLVHYCINAQLVEAGLAKSTGRLSSSDHIAWPQGGTSADGNSSDDFRSFLIGQHSGQYSTSARLIEGTPSFTLDLIKTIQGSDSAQIEQEDEEDEDDDEDDIRVGRGRSEVDVLMVKNPDEIYIKVKSRDPEVMQVEPNLIRRLQLHYDSGVAASARSMDTTWQKGDNIVAYNYSTAQYHRSIILQVLDDDGYIVLCRDRAIEFKAKSSSIYPLAEDFIQVPYLAKRIRLANIQPISGSKWSLLATDIVNTMCNLSNSDNPNDCRPNQKYYYRKTGAAYIVDNGEMSQPGILWVCNLISSGPLERSRYKYGSINKKLIHGGVAVSDTHNNPHIARYAHQRPPSKLSETQRKPANSTTSPTDLPRGVPTDVGTQQKQQFDILPPLLTPSHAASAMMRAFADLTDVLEKEDETSTSSESDMEIASKLRPTTSISVESSKSTVNKNVDEPTKVSPPTSYPPPLPLPERRFNGTATNVDEAAHIYVHPEQLTPVLAMLDENIQQSVKLYNQKMARNSPNNKTRPRTFKAGELCTVRFHMDKKWYRGKVTHVIPCNTAGGSAFEYRVQMVDYGNIEQVKFSDLCALILCPTVPITTTRVRLHQIEPKCGPWNTSILDTIHSLVVAKTLDVHLCDKTNTALTVPDAILRVDGTNINDYLLQEFDCLCRGKDSMNDKSDDEDVVIIEESDTSLTTPLVEEEPKENFNKSDDLKIFPNLEVGDKRVVRVIDVLNINVVTVEMAPDNIISLKSKYEEVFSSFNNSDIEHELLNDIRDGVHCLARYSGDNQYYRAEIMSILPPTTSSIDSVNVSVHVFYLDYGNREIVPRTHLRSLTPYDPLVRRLPALARMVALHCIRPLPNSPKLQDAALANLMELLQQKEVVMEVIRSDPKLSVNLLQPATDQVVYESLITDGLVIRANNDDSDDDYY